MIEIRDPVHGFIHLSDAERLIIDSQPFQRLRNIKQLGMTYYVYPGATHTRFEHSLGVMHVANEIFNVLERKFGKYFHRIFSLSDETEQRRFRNTLRLAALLHDIGHSPFSHTTEELLPENMPHEKLTVKIIREKLEDIFKKRHISRQGINIEDVIFLIYPEEVRNIDEEDMKSLFLLREILAGEIDADRIDYLIRDSLHTGVIYGRFDWMRLIETLTIVPHPIDISRIQNFEEIAIESPEPRIGIEYGGIHTVEGLLLARYFMFLQVYFHPVRRIYDLMLMDFLKNVLENGSYPADVNEYLEYDDSKILAQIKEEAKDGSSKEVRELARRILERKHPKKIFEERKVPLNLEEFEKVIKEELEDKLNLDPILDIYVDSPRKSTYKPEEAEFHVVNDEISLEVVEKWDIEYTAKKKKDKKIRHISVCSDLLKTLPTIERVRVYANVNRKKEKEKAEKVCRKVYNEFMGGKSRDK